MQKERHLEEEDLFTFEGTPIRGLHTKGQTLVYLKDFATALGYSNPCDLFKLRFAPLSACISRARRVMRNPVLGMKMVEALTKLREEADASTDDDEIVAVVIPPEVGDKRKCCSDDRKKKKKKRIRDLVKEVTDTKEKLVEVERMRDLLRYVLIDMKTTN